MTQRLFSNSGVLGRAAVRRSRTLGFTLIEVMVTVALVGILAAIALPSYSSYIKKSRAKGAASDLVALSLVMENLFQKTLSYPEYSNRAIPATDRTGLSNFSAWFASQSTYFDYKVTSNSSEYVLTASPKNTSVLNCTVTLNSSNVKSASGPDCGFSAW